MSTFKVGQQVKVVKAIDSHSEGWSNTWVSDMSDQIGKTLTVIHKDENDYGYELSDGFYYPSAALKLVPKRKPKTKPKKKPVYKKRKVKK